MATLPRRLSWRAVAIALLTAPAVSLLASIAVAWATGHILPLPLHVGVHTLFPLVLVVPLPLLAGSCLLGVLLAGLAHALGRGERHRERVGAVEAVVLVSGVQLSFLTAQLVLLSQLNGIPDAALALLAAAALQALVLTLASGTALAVRVVLGGIPAPVSTSRSLAASALVGPAALVFVRSYVHRLGTRRGPPRFLLSH